MGGKAIDLNLIPFGLSIEDGRFMDVADVPRGKHCGCFCPSCRTPLIARHGEVKEWHFAHASHAVYDKTKTKCEYSFYVSVRMMARQIIGSRLEIELPDYWDKVKRYDPRIGRPRVQSFSITKRKKVVLTDVEVERNFLNVPVDIFGHIGDFAFILYFTHPGRGIPPEFFQPKDDHCGIVAVSLDRLPALFFKKVKKSQDSYQAVLHRYLVSDLAAKRWIFHPRYDQCMEAAKQQLDVLIPPLPPKPKQANKPKVEDYRSSTDGAPLAKEVKPKYEPLPEDEFEEMEAIEPAPKKRLARFECVLCRITWQGLTPGIAKCPKCESHLYSSLKEYVDDLDETDA